MCVCGTIITSTVQYIQVLYLLSICSVVTIIILCQPHQHCNVATYVCSVCLCARVYVHACAQACVCMDTHGYTWILLIHII